MIIVQKFHLNMLHYILCEFEHRGT